MSDVLFEHPPDHFVRMASLTRQRASRKSAFLMVALAVGLAIFTSAAILSPSKGLLDWSLYALAVGLWILFISWQQFQVIRWKQRMTTRTSVDSVQIRVTGLAAPLDYETIERVFANPGLPFFVIERKLPAAPRYVIVQKDHVGDPKAFLAAIRRRVAVSDTTLANVGSDRGRTR